MSAGISSEILLNQLEATRSSLKASLALIDGLISAFTPKPKAPGCPKCGSPKRSDVSGMGRQEWKCTDCGAVYTEAADGQ